MVKGLIQLSQGQVEFFLAAGDQEVLFRHKIKVSKTLELPEGRKNAASCKKGYLCFTFAQEPGKPFSCPASCLPVRPAGRPGTSTGLQELMAGPVPPPMFPGMTNIPSLVR